MSSAPSTSCATSAAATTSSASLPQCWIAIPQIHLLVNNAGIPGRAGFATIEPDRLEELIRVNYLGGRLGAARVSPRASKPRAARTW